MNDRNRVYVTSLLEKADAVYIDTASLMEVPGIDMLISNYKDLFEEYGCRITVIPSVCLELVRHLGSNNTEKAAKAMHVLELFKENPNMFIVENDELDENELMKAFADQELYMTISDGRKKGSQLLITNDRGLSTDIFGLNYLRSMKGFHISVCFISRLGELHMCECVKNEAEKTDKVDTDIDDLELSSEKNISEQDSTIITEKQDAEKIACNETWPTFLKVFIGFGIGYGSAKYGGRIINKFTTLL